MVIQSTLLILFYFYNIIYERTLLPCTLSPPYPLPRPFVRVFCSSMVLVALEAPSYTLLTNYLTAPHKSNLEMFTT